jgi:hypothetical protein
VDLTELEEALDGFDFLEYYFVPATGRTVPVKIDEDFDDLDDEDEEEQQIPEDAETLPIDRLNSRTKFKWMEEFANSVHSVTARFQQQGDVDLVRHGDLPLIVLTSQGWLHVQTWVHGEEVRRATMANQSTLKQIVLEWRHRPRDTQVQLLETLKSFPAGQVGPVLETWHAVCGKEMRARIEQFHRLQSS